MQHLRRAPGRHVTFGASGADYHVSGPSGSAVLTGPGGPIAEVRAMAPRAAPRRHQRPRRIGARHGDRPGRSRRRRHGARRVPRSGAPHRARRRGRGRGLVRRLQGHHPTRRLGGDPRLRPRRAHRRRTEQGPRPDADDGHPRTHTRRRGDRRGRRRRGRRLRSGAGHERRADRARRVDGRGRRRRRDSCPSRRRRRAVTGLRQLRLVRRLRSARRRLPPARRAETAFPGHADGAQRWTLLGGARRSHRRVHSEPASAT